MYSWQLKHEELASFQTVFTGVNNAAFNHTCAEEHVPEPVKKWLGRLCLLYGLPFDYLVSEESMLPEESIRFFYIDPNWIKIMIDGATSIGRITTSDLHHDQQFVELLYSTAVRESQMIRPILQGREVKEISAEVGWRTGFLLRSVLVSNWPGLQIKAFAKKDTTEEQSLPILRVERLANDTLLCIVEGVFQRLEIHEPAEGVHFGADYEEGSYTVELRKLGDGIGETIPNESVQVPMRDTESGVVDVEKLAELLKTKLAQVNGYTGEFTSAEFAIQMIEGVDSCVFENF